MVRQPLIHYITHPIVMNDCANAILAVGGSPIMAEHHEEIWGITSKAAALVVNLGNITDYRMQAMQLAGEVASENGLPIVLDLTGVAVSAVRKRFANDFIDTYAPQMIKGNVSEILALLDFETRANGVDTGDHHLSEHQLQAIQNYCQHHACQIIVTGAIDLIADAEQFVCIQNGSAQLAQLTGTGCILSGLLGYFVSDNLPLTAAIKALGLMNIASEYAEKKSHGLGSFKVALFDFLGNLDASQIEQQLSTFESDKVREIYAFREKKRDDKN